VRNKKRPELEYLEYVAMHSDELYIIVTRIYQPTTYQKGFTVIVILPEICVFLCTMVGGLFFLTHSNALSGNKRCSRKATNLVKTVLCFQEAGFQEGKT
jgi:hypothetical protein